MAAKKSCSCPLFTCFSHKKITLFAYSGSSEVALPSLNVFANPSEPTLTREESGVISSAAAPYPKAIDDSQPCSISAVAPSQRVAPSPAASSFSQYTVTSFPLPTTSQAISSPPAHLVDDTVFAIRPFSVPSSTSVPKESDLAESDLAKNIRKATDAVDKENADADFKELSNYMPTLLDFFKNLRGFLPGTGMTHMATTAFLVVANILQRWEAISTNKEACLFLLEVMNILVQDVRKLEEWMRASISKTTKLIVKVSIACCTQIEPSKFKPLMDVATKK